MDADLYPVLTRASQEELLVILRYAQLHQSDVLCTPAALNTLILDMAYQSYASNLANCIKFLGAEAPPYASVEGMEATILSLLFNQTLPKMSPAERLQLRQSWYRYGLRQEDWQLVMEVESVDCARLQYLLMAEGILSQRLMEELVQLIFSRLLSQGDPEGRRELMSANPVGHALLGASCCLLADAFNWATDGRFGTLIPITVWVAILRKQQKK